MERNYRSGAARRRHVRRAGDGPLTTQCRLWCGPLKNGYAHDHVRGYLHRWVWEQVHGPIPAGLEVMHLCPACFRFDHLALGTHAENMAAMSARGRSRNQHSESVS